jgi:uncharacterized protein YoxC
MLKSIIDLARRLLLLAEDTQQNKTEIKELRQEIQEIRQELGQLVSAVQHLAYEIRRVSDTEVHEREKMVLRLENELLRSQRMLPREHPDIGQKEE